MAEEDAGEAAAVRAAGVDAVVRPLWMSDTEASAAIAEAALTS